VNANEDFDSITRVPILRAYGRRILHSGTYAERNGGLCVNPHWVVRSKNLR
jgi:hypothetical protein